MVTLTIENAKCRVSGLDPETEKRIKHELRYQSQSVSYSYNKNLAEIEKLSNLLNNNRFNVNKAALEEEITKLQRTNSRLIHGMYVMLYKNGEFPTGLLPRVLSALKDSDISYEIKDIRVVPSKLQNKYVLKKSLPPMRYYQRTGARLASEKGRGILVFPTGTGKSLTAAKMIWELGVNTLIITPNKSITVNMIDTLTEYFGKGAVAKLNTKSKKLKSINVVNIQALIRMPAEIFNSIDAVFIDEFHHAAAETYQEVNNNHLKNCYFRIGLTATNFRNDGSDLALEGVLSEVLYEYTIQQAIKDKFLVKPRFELIKNKVKAENDYQKEYKEGLVLNAERNALITEIVKKHGRDSVIVLVQQVEHGESLTAMIPGSAFLHGEEKDDVRVNTMEKYRKGQIRDLIGTSVIGEGVDLPIAKVLVMAGGGKAKSAIMQNIGRVLRPFAGKDEAIVYDFADLGSNFLSEHSALRQEIYKQYDIEISEEIE